MGHSLKPQDVMVALKLCSYQRKRPPMSIVAADLGMSSSEVHAAIKHLQQARLLHGPEMEDKPNFSSLEEFLLHGGLDTTDGERLISLLALYWPRISATKVRNGA